MGHAFKKLFNYMRVMDIKLRHVNHGASKKKIFDIELSGLVAKNAKRPKMQKCKKFVLLMISLKKIFFAGGS